MSNFIIAKKKVKLKNLRIITLIDTFNIKKTQKLLKEIKKISINFKYYNFNQQKELL